MKQIKRSLALFLVLLIGILSACGSAGGSTKDEIPYDKQPGRILIQLFTGPGFVMLPMFAVPEWTLYGDGTLIYRSNKANQLQQAQLSSSEIQQILDMVVKQQAFFSSTQETYGRLVPDIGTTLLTVNAQNQRKTVKLLLEPENLQDADIQTQHVFAIRSYLLNYKPDQERTYVPPGVALLAYPFEGNPPSVSKWPYEGISLALVAQQECIYFSQPRPCTKRAAGIFPVYGQRGLDLLKWSTSPNRPAMVAEDGKMYRVMVWPLLPDALVKQTDGTQGIYTLGIKPGRKPLLPGPGSGTLQTNRL
jgi:hypothetical protein